jgi:GntR family galactonate operon transcriptional repressor
MVDRVARGCFDQPLMGRQYEDVMRELVDAIVGGEYPEGGWLPSLDELGARLGASRGVLREALRGLEERGLIAVQAGRGQLIRQREEWDTRSPDVLRACIDRGPDPGVLSQVVEARAVVEREAATHACAFATDADFGLLRSRIAAMERALEPAASRTLGADDAFVVADAWFHRILAALSENPVLAKLVEPIHLPLAELRRVRAPERDSTALHHHRRILEGVSSREPELAQAAVTAYARQLRRWLGAR